MGSLKGIPVAIASLGLGALLAACTGFRAANEGNFTRVLDSYFANQDECLYATALHFPYEASAGEKTPALDALTDARLLERTEEKAIAVKRYSLTPYARNQVDPRFCYGHRQVTSIDSFTAPEVVNGQPATQVKYHYKLLDLPAWAKSAEMRKTFPALAKSSSGHAQDTARLVLTANGWHVPE